MGIKNISEEVWIMQEIIDFIKSDVGTITGYVFGVVGLISAYWTYRSYRDGIKQSKRYSILFDAADKKLEKDIIDKELILSKREREEISQDISLMKEDISANIPSAAKKAALVSKLEEQIDLLSEQYNSVCETRKKLDELSDDKNFMSEVEEIVKGEITPAYYQDKEKRYLKDKIIVITLLILFINQFLQRSLSIVVSIIGVTYILPDAKTLLKYNRVDIIGFVENFIIRAVTILSIFWDIVVVFYILENNRLNILRRIYNYEIAETEAILITAIVSFLVMFIMEIKFIYKIERCKIVFVWIPAVLTGIYLAMYFNIMSASTIVSLSYIESSISYSSRMFIISILIIELVILLPKFIKVIYSFMNKKK